MRPTSTGLTRWADDLVKALGMSGISMSQVSRLCTGIDERVSASLNGRWKSAPCRAIDPSANGARPYLWIDATYVKVRQNGRIVLAAGIVEVCVKTGARC
jgi:putative transposase